MRPQSWFVCDLETGAPLVKRLFLYGQDDVALADYLEAHGVAKLPWLNPSRANSALAVGATETPDRENLCPRF